MKNIIKEFFTKGHKRSINAKKNILSSIALKGISIGTGFLIVPITINYVNPTNYGIWLTLSSVVGWFNILDIGLGHGLRNKFAEALAAGDDNLAKTYVSTTYAIVIGIMAIFYFLFLAINPVLNWVKILNAPYELSNELYLLVIIVVTFFSLHFIVKLIGTLLLSDQKTALNDFINVSANVVSLCIVYILTKTSSGSLLYLGITFTSIPVLSYFIASVLLYRSRYRKYFPSIKFIDFRYAKNLTSLGINFFLIQISGIVIYSTSNIIITQMLGPGEVTPYNIVYKYFNIVSMLFMIVLSPFWSGFTEAYYKNDIVWVKNTMKKLNSFSIIVVLVVVIMVFLAEYVYKIWVGDTFKIPFLLTFFMGVYVSILAWGAPFVFFMNGVGKIKVQLFFSLIQAIVFVVLSILFTKYLNYGSTGVIAAMCIPMIPTIFLWPYQYKLIVNNKETWIWGR